MRQISRAQRRIRHCYEKELRLKPALKGTVMLEWQIQANGQPTDVTVQSSLNNSTVESCLTRQILDLRFARDDKSSRSCQVRVPFVFSSVKVRNK